MDMVEAIVVEALIGGEHNYRPSEEPQLIPAEVVARYAPKFEIPGEKAAARNKRMAAFEARIADEAAEESDSGSEDETENGGDQS